MVFAAQKLRLHPALKNPTVLIVVDRIDLDTPDHRHLQRRGHAEPGQGRHAARSCSSCWRRTRARSSSRRSTSSARPTACLNDRSNIIVLVDEAHRTQEGDLGRKMREALPNAFLFGLTGTPINRADRNTFYAFGADEDEKGYMSRYGFEESIRDGATLPLHFEPRLLDLHIDKAAIEHAYKELTGGLTDLDKDNLAKTAAKMAVLVKTPERIRTVCADIAEHFQDEGRAERLQGAGRHLRPRGCLLYKAALDKLLPPEASDIVMSVQSADKKEHPEYAAYDAIARRGRSCSTASATQPTR